MFILNLYLIITKSQGILKKAGVKTLELLYL